MKCVNSGVPDTLVIKQIIIDVLPQKWIRIPVWKMLKCRAVIIF